MNLQYACNDEPKLVAIPACNDESKLVAIPACNDESNLLRSQLATTSKTCTIPACNDEPNLLRSQPVTRSKTYWDPSSSRRVKTCCDPSLSRRDKTCCLTYETPALRKLHFPNAGDLFATDIVASPTCPDESNLLRSQVVTTRQNVS